MIFTNMIIARLVVSGNFPGLSNRNNFPSYFIQDMGNGTIAEGDWMSLTATVYQIGLPIALGLLTTSLLYDTIRFGIKKEYTAVERKGWYWSTLIFKLILAMILVNFPYLFSLVYGICHAVKLGFDGSPGSGSLANSSAFMYLQRTDLRWHEFDVVSDTIKPIITDAYNLILKIGLGVLALAAIVAGTSFGVCKDTQLVRENKAWLIRVLTATALTGSVLGFIGIFAKIRF